MNIVLNIAGDNLKQFKVMQFKQKLGRPASRRVAKSRPITVNFPLPKDAVGRLRDLAISRDQRLLNLGVLAVQIRDDESIVLGIELEKTKKKANKASVTKKSGLAQRSDGVKSNFALTSAGASYAAMESTSVGFHTDNLGGTKNWRSETPKAATPKRVQSSGASKQRNKKGNQGARRGRPSAQTGFEINHPFMNVSVGASTWEEVYRNIGTPNERRPLKRQASADLTLETPKTSKGFIGDGNISKSAESKRSKTASSPRVSSPVYSDPEDGLSSVSSSPCSHSPMNSDELLNLFIDEKFSATSVLRQLAENHDQNSGKNVEEKDPTETSPGDDDGAGSKLPPSGNNAEQISTTCGESNTTTTTQCDTTATKPEHAETTSNNKETTDSNQMHPPSTHHAAANMLTSFSQLHTSDSSNVNTPLTTGNSLVKSHVQSPTASANIAGLRLNKTRSLADRGCISSSTVESTSHSSTRSGNSKSPANTGQVFEEASSSEFSVPHVSSVTAPKKSRSFAQLGIYPESYRREMHMDLKNTTRTLLHQPTISPNNNTTATMPSYSNLNNFYMSRQMSTRGFPVHGFYGNTINLPVESTAPSRISQSQGHPGYYAVAGSNNTTTMTTCMNSPMDNAHAMSSFPKSPYVTSSVHPGVASYRGTDSIQSCSPVDNSSALDLRQTVRDKEASNGDLTKATTTEVMQPALGTPAAFPEIAALPERSAEVGSGDLTNQPNTETNPNLSYTDSQPITVKCEASVTPSEMDKHKLDTDMQPSTVASCVLPTSSQTGVYTFADINNNVNGNTGPQYALSYVYPMGTVWYPYVAVTPYAMLANNTAKKQDAVSGVTKDGSDESGIGTTTASSGLASTTSSTQYIDLASSLRYWQQLSLLYKNRMQLGAANVTYPPMATPMAGMAPRQATPTFGGEVATAQTARPQEISVISSVQSNDSSSESSSQASTENTANISSHEKDTSMETTVSNEHSEATSTEASVTASEVTDNTSEIRLDTSNQDKDEEALKQGCPSSVIVTGKPSFEPSVEETMVEPVTDDKLSDVKLPSPALSSDREKTECISPLENNKVDEPAKIKMENKSSDDSAEQKDCEIEISVTSEDIDSNASGGSNKSEENQANTEHGTSSSPTPELSFVHESSIACVNVANNNSSTQTTEEPKKSGNGKEGKTRSAKRRKSKK